MAARACLRAGLLSAWSTTRTCRLFADREPALSTSVDCVRLRIPPNPGETMAFSASDEQNDLSLIENRARSVAHLFVDRVAKSPDAEAFRFPQAEAWESVTWAQTDDRVR